MAVVPIVGMPDPLDHFAQTSLAPVAGGGSLKPFPPLPGASGTSAATVGYTVDSG